MAKKAEKKKTTKKAASRKKSTGSASKAKRAAAKKSTKSPKSTKSHKAVAEKPATAKKTKSTKKITKAKSTARSGPKTAKKSTKSTKKSVKRAKSPKAAQPKPSTARKTEPQSTGSNETKPKTRERKLSKSEIEQFRYLLLQKRAEILGDVTTLHDEALNKNRSESAGDLSSMPIHMADLGSDNYELEFTLGLIEGERAILREIDEALERIEKGTYGYCLATGQPIGRPRLRAKPWAKYCYEYTLAQERGQTQTRGY